MNKIVLNLAISLDGYIADENGGFDWIKGHDDRSLDTEKKFDFEAFVDQMDVIVMGSEAYLDCPEESLKSFSSKKVVVATSRQLEHDDNVELVNGDVCTRILEIQKEVEKDIWLFGGGGLVDPFIKNDIVDEYIIGIIPIILGKGRKLFGENNPTLRLHLDECVVDDGITLLTYTRSK